MTILIWYRKSWMSYTINHFLGCLHPQTHIKGSFLAKTLQCSIQHNCKVDFYFYPESLQSNKTFTVVKLMEIYFFKIFLTNLNIKVTKTIKEMLFKLFQTLTHICSPFPFKKCHNLVFFFLLFHKVMADSIIC